MKPSKDSIIEQYKQALEIERGNTRTANREMLSYKDHIAVVTAENESLRKDKSWLQSMLSNVMQSIATRKV